MTPITDPNSIDNWKPDGLVVAGGEPLLRSLADILAVQPPSPSEADDTPPVFAFTRKRAVTIDWAALVSGDERPVVTSIAAMRRYFEASWFPGKPAPHVLSAADFKELKAKRLIVQIEDLQEGEEIWLAENADGELTPTKCERGIIFVDGISRRRYLAMVAAGVSLSAGNDFLNTDEDYQNAWSHLLGFQLVFGAQADAAGHLTAFEEIDLRPGVIERRAVEIAGRLELAALMEKTLTTLVANKIAAAGDQEAFDQATELQERLTRARIERFELQRELDKLTALTAGLGYELKLYQEPAVEGKPQPPPGYRVIRKTQRTVRWTTTHFREIIEYGFLWLTRTLRREYFTRQHQQVVPVDEPVVSGEDPVAVWQDRHREQHPQAQFFLFEETAAGYATADGLSLRAVMDRCRIDEAFRLNCVVMLPIYDARMTGRRALIKYHNFIRPMPGIVPAIMPRLAISESLSYKTAWKGLEVGELVSTINLAPGEERTVKISKQFQQETVIEKATTSVFEVERTDTSDLAVEMEREFEEEQTHTTSAELSASINYSSMFVSGEASARAGVDTSNRTFAKTLNKVARKASQSVSQRNRQEVKTTSTARTTVTTSDETVAQVKNINEGRTLNLMFHRLYNRYEGGLFIEDLQFEVVPAVELIAGSGVFEARRFNLPQFDEVIDLLEATPLPFELNPQGRDALARTVMGQVEVVFQKEYGKAAVARDGSDPAPEARLLSANVLPFAARTGQAHDSALALADLAKDLCERLQKAIAGLDQRQVVERVPLLVGTAGLYLDAQVGARPSTEPYSERMRDAEISLRQAEVFAREAEGMLDRAEALRVARITAGGDGLVLTSLRYDRETLKTLTLGFNRPLPEGRWAVLLDGREVDGARFDRPAIGSGEEVVIAFGEPQEWLRSPDLLFRIEVRETVSGWTTGFPLLASRPAPGGA